MPAKNWDVTYTELQRRNRRARIENRITIGVALIVGSGVVWWMLR